MPELLITADGYRIKCNVTVKDRRVAFSLFGILRAFETSVVRAQGNDKKGNKILVGKRIGAEK